MENMAILSSTFLKIEPRVVMKQGGAAFVVGLLGTQHMALGPAIRDKFNRKAPDSAPEQAQVRHHYAHVAWPDLDASSGFTLRTATSLAVFRHGDGP